MSSFRFAFQHFLLVTAVVSIPMALASEDEPYSLPEDRNLQSKVLGNGGRPRNPFLNWFTRPKPGGRNLRSKGSKKSGKKQGKSSEDSSDEDGIQERCSESLILSRVSDEADTADDLVPAFEDFRSILGDPNNGSDPKSNPTGHRQINWDADIVPFDMPGDFFAVNVPRGAHLTSGVDGEGTFRVSEVVGERASEFSPFSDPNLFSPIDDNEFFVNFVNPGNPEQDAVVSGFGGVFVDVDLPGITKMEYFTKEGCLLDTAFVNPRPSGLSFVGVDFGVPIVAQVKITLGTTALIDFPEDGEIPVRRHLKKGKGSEKKEPKNQALDFVVMDDFLYGEPTVPAVVV